MRQLSTQRSSLRFRIRKLRISVKSKLTEKKLQLLPRRRVDSGPRKQRLNQMLPMTRPNRMRLLKLRSKLLRMPLRELKTENVTRVLTEKERKYRRVTSMMK